MIKVISRAPLYALLLVSAHAALAQTADVQMLPPTNFNTTAPCDMSSNLNQVLVFNPGAANGSAINCNLNFTADSNGYVSARGFWAAPSPVAGFAAYDRNIENGFVGWSAFYRDSDITHLFDSTVGDVMTYNTSGNVTIRGHLGVAGEDPIAGMPTDWSGIHTWDLYANGSVAAGTGGAVAAYMNNAGNIAATGTIQVGTGSCTAAGQLQWNGTKIQFCDGNVWKDLGGSARTWHSLSIPASDRCMQNDSPNEMTITMSCFGYRWGMELYITAGPDSGSCGNFTAGEGGVAHVPGPGPSTFGMQGTIPPGWWWKWTAAAGTIPGVANCTSGSALY